MQSELSLMWEQHGRQPDTWGHFHFPCQLWQTAISTAEKNPPLFLAHTHPSQTTLLFFQVPKQYVILSKLEISELSMMGLKMTSNGCLISYRVPKTCFVMKGAGKKENRSKIWLAFSGWCCQKLLLSYKFRLHVGCLSPNLPPNFSKLELVHSAKSRKWGEQRFLTLLNKNSFWVASAAQTLSVNRVFIGALVFWYRPFGEV